MSEPLTQAMFFQTMQLLKDEMKAYSDEHHLRLRGDLTHGFEEWSKTFRAHELKDQEVAIQVALLRDKRREDERREGLRTTVICAIATGCATLTMGILRLLHIL